MRILPKGKFSGSDNLIVTSEQDSREVTGIPDVKDGRSGDVIQSHECVL